MSPLNRSFISFSLRPKSFTVFFKAVNSLLRFFAAFLISVFPNLLNALLFLPTFLSIRKLPMFSKISFLNIVVSSLLTFPDAFAKSLASLSMLVKCTSTPFLDASTVFKALAKAGCTSMSALPLVLIVASTLSILLKILSLVLVDLVLYSPHS